MKSHNRSFLRNGLIILLLCMVSSPLFLRAQKEKPVYRYYYSDQEKQANVADKPYKLLPPSVFLTFNAGLQWENSPEHAFSYRNPSFGLKVGTMRNTGWFFDFSTNFNFKGAFKFIENNETVQNVKNSKFYGDATIGITGRYFKPVTFLFGVGAFYYTLNSKTANGTWGHEIQNVKFGPMISAGFMFHIYKVALSVETTCNYNLANRSETKGIQAERIGLGVRVGVGFCFPRNMRKSYALTNAYRDELYGYGKDLRKQTPVSYTPLSSDEK